MKRNIFILALGTLLMQSCLDDSGNYDYSELVPIEIDETSLQNSYRVTQLNYLVIDPKVKQGTDDSNLRYEWKIFQESKVPNTETGKVVNDVVGTERRLNYMVTTPPGDYTLSLKVSDKQNNVSEIVSRVIHIESYAPVGLMVMHGDSEFTDVSILVNDRMVSDVDKDEVKHNIFSATNGKRVPGAPGMLAYTINTQNVNIMTKGATCGYRTRGSDLAILGTYSEMFTEPFAQGPDFQGYAQWSYNQLLIDNGKLYFASIPSASFTQFDIPVFGLEYYAEPYIGVMKRGYYFGIFYDRLSRRFLSINNQRVLTTFKEPGASAAFDMNNVGMDMVYAEHGFGDRWYCIMSKPDMPDNHYVYVCDFSRFDDGNRGVAKYDVTACSDMKDARCFAVGNRSELIYYATATEIKQCNYTSGGTSSLRYVLPDNLKSTGYEICMLQVFKVDGHENSGRLLYVGIYNAKTGDGKLLECPFVETTGEIIEDDIKVYDGFKRISNVCYKYK